MPSIVHPGLIIVILLLCLGSDKDLLRSQMTGDRMAKASESSLRRSMLVMREVSMDLGERSWLTPLTSHLLGVTSSSSSF